MIKDEHKIIILSFIAAITIWVIDAVIDTLIFHSGTFSDILLFDVPSHELYFRLFFAASFVIFGVIISRILSKRRRLQDSLFEAIVEVEEEKAKTQAIIAAMGDAISIQDTDFRILYQNQIHKDIVGDHTGEYCYIAYGRNDRVCEGCPVARSFEDGNIHTLEKSNMTDKGFIHIDITASPLRDSAGKTIAGIEIVRDITKRKQSEEALKEVNARLQTLLQAIPDMVFFKDARGRHLVVNKAIEEFTGLRHEDVVGKTNEELLHPDLAESCRKSDEEVLKNRRTLRYEEQSINRDGERRFFDTVKAPIYDNYGDVAGMVGVSRDVTERKHAEELLKESERKYKNIIELATDIIYISDKDGKQRFMNDAAFRILGYSPEDVIGQPFINLIHPDDRERTFRKRMEMSEKGIDVFNFENRYITKSGKPINVLHNVRVLRNEKGEVVGTQGIARDITERKRSEEKLKLFSEAIGEAMDGVQITDLNGNIVYSNKAVEEIYGFTAEELLGKHVNEMNADKEFAGKVIIPGIREKGRWNGELMVFHKDGREFPIWLSTSLVKNDRGEPIAMIGIIRDISERKRVEAELKRHRKHLAELVGERTAALKSVNKELQREILERKGIESRITANNALLKLFSQTFSRKEYLAEVVKLISEWSDCKCAGIRILDEHGNIPYESYVGFSQEFWESENFLSIEKDQCACIRVFTENPEPQDSSSMSEGGSFYTNNTIKFISGLTDKEKTRFRGVCARSGFLSVAIVPIRYQKKMLGVIHLADEMGEKFPLKVIEFLELISSLIAEAIYRFSIEDELRRNYDVLQETNVLLEQVFSNIHVLIAYLDTEFNFIGVNHTYAEADGHDPDFFIGKNHFDLYPNEKNEAIFRSVVETGEPYFAYAKPFEYAGHQERGVTYWDWSLQPVKDAAGTVNGLVLSLINVTEKIVLQSEAMQAAHLASLGELAAGVAHEINNPLNGIINYAQILSNRIEKGSSESDIANRILKEGDRIANIVRSLLSFARKREEGKNVINILGILSDTLLLTEAQILKESIKLKVDVPQDLPEIIGNPQQIQQVFLNIINNARYALNQKYPEADEDKILEVSGEKMTVDDYPYIRISFYDRGSGIPANIMDKVMNPFFSTKPSGKGTGLGLSISHGIISAHGGKLIIDSVEGEFTRLIIDLPSVIRGEK